MKCEAERILKFARDFQCFLTWGEGTGVVLRMRDVEDDHVTYFVFRMASNYASINAMPESWGGEGGLGIGWGF